MHGVVAGSPRIVYRNLIPQNLAELVLHQRGEGVLVADTAAKNHRVPEQQDGRFGRYFRVLSPAESEFICLKGSSGMIAGQAISESGNITRDEEITGFHEEGRRLPG